MLISILLLYKCQIPEIAVDIATESIKKQGIMNLEIEKIKRKYQNLAFSLEND